MFWSGFLMWIPWWWLFCDWSDHIWQYQHTPPLNSHQNHFKTYTTLMCLLISPYMIISIIPIINGHHHWIHMKNSLQNIYNTYMFAGIAIYSHSDHKTDITIESASKNHSRTYITLTCLPVLPYMVTPITKQTSPSNPHQKTTPEHI